MNPKKKSANESAECRQNRLASKRKYQKEKRVNESAECRQNTLIFEIVLQVVTNNLTTPFIHDDFGIKCIP